MDMTLPESMYALYVFPDQWEVTTHPFFSNYGTEITSAETRGQRHGNSFLSKYRSNNGRPHLCIFVQKGRSIVPSISSMITSLLGRPRALVYSIVF